MRLSTFSSGSAATDSPRHFIIRISEIAEKVESSRKKKESRFSLKASGAVFYLLNLGMT